MSYQEFINNQKLYNESIAQGEFHTPYPFDYQGEDLEDFLKDKYNPPKEAVAALEHVYGIKRAQLLKDRTPVDYYNLYKSVSEAKSRFYDEVLIPEFEKKVKI